MNALFTKNRNLHTLPHYPSHGARLIITDTWITWHCERKFYDKVLSENRVEFTNKIFVLNTLVF